MKKKQFDFKSRVQKLRDILSLDSKTAVLMTDKKDVLYFSGFSGTKSFFLLTGSRSFLITDFRYFERFEKENCFGELFRVQSGYFDDIASLILRLGLKNIFLDEAKVFYETVNELSSRLPQVTFEFGKNISSHLRIVKEKDEIDIIKQGAKKTLDIFSKVLNFLKEGISERELAIKIEIMLLENGFNGVAFPPIVLFGENSSMPHGEPGSALLKKNQPVLIDFGGIFKGYCTDFTRTVFYGNPDFSFVNMYDKLLSCQMAVIENGETGMKAYQLDGIARHCLDKESLGDFFKHSLGHGVGLDIHEEPMLSPFNDNEIKNGMVFTVEPGIYFENRFGIRIEDMVVVQNDKLNVLTDFPKELILIKQE